MIAAVTVNGVLYHADEDSGALILDEDNKPIPAYICICSAWDEFECSCGAWDVPIPEEVADAH